MSTAPYAAHDNGFLARRRPSPIGIGGAIAIHIGVAAVLLMMPGMPLGDKIIYVDLPTHTVPPPNDPPPKKEIPKDQKPTLQKPMVTTIDPIVPLKSDTDFVPPRNDPPPGQGTFDPPFVRPTIPEVTPPPHKPVFIDSKMDPRFAGSLQPDYPPARLRVEEEGKATIRIKIGTDGRVLSAELVSATHPDFWKATQAQALKAWRFIPATRDGMPVESERVMTVYFKMDG